MWRSQIAPTALALGIKHKLSNVCCSRFDHPACSMSLHTWLLSRSLYVSFQKVSCHSNLFMVQGLLRKPQHNLRIQVLLGQELSATAWRQDRHRSQLALTLPCTALRLSGASITVSIDDRIRQYLSEGSPKVVLAYHYLPKTLCSSCLSTVNSAYKLSETTPKRQSRGQPHAQKLPKQMQLLSSS